MHISSKGKLRIITYSVFLFFIFFNFYLAITGIISSDQSFVFWFSLIAAYVVVDGMIKTPVISKKLRIVIAGTLIVAIQFLAILLVIAPINSGLSVWIMFGVSLSLSGAISYVTWNAKRKLKLTTNEMPKN